MASYSRSATPTTSSSRSTGDQPEPRMAATGITGTSRPGWLRPAALVASPPPLRPRTGRLALRTFDRRLKWTGHGAVGPLTWSRRIGRPLLGLSRVIDPDAE